MFNKKNVQFYTAVWFEKKTASIFNDRRHCGVLMVAKHQENTNKDEDIYRSHPLGSSMADAQCSWSTPAWCSAALTEPRPRFAPALTRFWIWVKVSDSAETELLHWWRQQQIPFITSASWRSFVSPESVLYTHTYIYIYKRQIQIDLSSFLAIVI